MNIPTPLGMAIEALSSDNRVFDPGSIVSAVLPDYLGAGVGYHVAAAFAAYHNKDLAGVLAFAYHRFEAGTIRTEAAAHLIRKSLPPGVTDLSLITGQYEQFVQPIRSDALRLGPLKPGWRGLLRARDPHPGLQQYADGLVLQLEQLVRSPII